MKQANIQISLDEKQNNNKPLHKQTFSSQSPHEDHITAYLTFLEFLVFDS